MSASYNIPGRNKKRVKTTLSPLAPSFCSTVAQALCCDPQSGLTAHLCSHTLTSAFSVLFSCSSLLHGATPWSLFLCSLSPLDSLSHFNYLSPLDTEPPDSNMGMVQHTYLLIGTLTWYQPLIIKAVHTCTRTLLVSTKTWTLEWRFLPGLIPTRN